MKHLKPLFFSLFVFSLLGWIYIVLNAEVHPDTLDMPLTHFLSFPREDTFGSICFVISFFSFFVWNVLKEKEHHGNHR